MNSINTNTDISKVWQKVNRISGKYRPTPLPIIENSDGTIIHEPAEVADIFAEYYTNQGSEENYSRHFLTHKLNQESNEINFRSRADEPYNDEIHMKELQNALSRTSESSPGLDKITYSMVKNSQESLINLILKPVSYTHLTLPTKRIV